MILPYNGVGRGVLSSQAWAEQSGRRSVFVSLSEDQRRFIATVRALAQGEFRGRALQYQDGTFPWENMRALAELGVLGMAVPEEYGGGRPAGREGGRGRRVERGGGG